MLVEITIDDQVIIWFDLMLLQCFQVAIQSLVADPKVFWTGQYGYPLISLFDKMLCGLEPSIFIINPDTWRFEVGCYTVKDNHGHLFFLDLFEMIKDFCLAGDGNDKSIHQTVEQPAGIHDFTSKRFIALTNHDGISRFEGYF